MPHRRSLPSGRSSPRARLRRTLAAALALAGVATGTACTSYDAVQAGVVPTDREVRVELTDLAAATLAPALGAGVVAVDGRVQTRDDAGLTVVASGTVQRNGDTQGWRGEPVRLRWADVARVQTRRTDARRTALAAAAIVGGAIALAVAVGTDFSFSGSGRGGTRPPL